MKVIHTELKVNLPNHEYTKVGIKPGLTIADALSKAMKKRNLDTKTYEAIMVSDPEKRPIPWQCDISEIKSDEIKLRKILLEVIFVDHGHTSVSRKVGLSVQDALSKAMNKRKLAPKTCTITLVDDPKKTKIPWNSDISDINGDAIKVEVQNLIRGSKSISHKFKEKTFFTMDCNACNGSLLMQKSLHCVNCGYKFHVECANRVPKLCSNLKNGIFEDEIEAFELSLDDLIDHDQNSKVLDQSSQKYRNLKKDELRAEGYVQFDEVEINSNSESGDLELLPASPNFVRDGEEWELQASEILCKVKNVGKGSFGTVYKGYYWGDHVAVKILNVKNPSNDQFEAFRNEVALLQKARHINVLLLIGCVSRRDILTIVTKWCDASTLYKYIHDEKSNFELLKMIKIVRQTSQGMDYLHGRSIIHRDLKSNNVFLEYFEGHFVVKIGDFGLATVKSEKGNSQSVHQAYGSILWMAPEIINPKIIENKDPFSFLSDVYSFGIVLYEILSGMLPYTDRNGRRPHRDIIMWKVGRNELVPNLDAIGEATPSELRKLLASCISFNRDQRPPFAEVLHIVEIIIKSLPEFSPSVLEPLLS